MAGIQRRTASRKLQRSKDIEPAGPSQILSFLNGAYYMFNYQLQITMKRNLLLLSYLPAYKVFPEPVRRSYLRAYKAPFYVSFCTFCASLRLIRTVFTRPKPIFWLESQCFEHLYFGNQDLQGIQILGFRISACWITPYPI